MGDRRFHFAWLLPPIILALFVVHTTTTLLLAGLLALASGTVVALNYRGVADRMPPRLGFSAAWRDGSRASTRKSFAGVAIWGFLMIVIALARPGLIR